MRVGIEAEEGAIPLVQEAAVGGREDLPGDRAEEGRRHERGHDEEAHEAMAGHVGPRHQPGERRGDEAGERRNAERDGNGREERADEAAVGGEAREIHQGRRARLVGEAVPQQPTQRQQHEHAEHERQHAEHRQRRVEPCAAQRGGDGHKLPLGRAPSPSRALAGSLPLPTGERVGVRGPLKILQTASLTCRNTRRSGA